MFELTDEDRRFQTVEIGWRESCKLNLVQDAEKFTYWRHESREESILRNSFGAVLQERTALSRLMFRMNWQTRYGHLIHVLVSQRAVEEAMAQTRMKAMSRRNVRKLISLYVSDDFEVTSLEIDYDGSESGGYTLPGERYTSFYLHIRLDR